MIKIRPLAYRMRPSKIEEVIGQQHLIGKGKPIQRMVESKQLSSMLLFGPPGIGKTTLSQSIAGSTGIPFRQVNAVNSSKKELEKIINESLNSDSSFLLFIDEIHRFTKTQIEILLPYMESGDLIVIGSTTESVFHSLPSAILSRSTIFPLKPLKPEDVMLGLKRAIIDKNNGLGNIDVRYDEETLNVISNLSGGDMRTALNTLEAIVISNTDNDKSYIDIDSVQRFTERKQLGYNGNTSRYNLMSALQKSIRGSDVDASLYYLALLLESGDLDSIHRRLLIIADEDIGLANLTLSTHVLTAIQISEKTGYPECRIPLSKAVIEMCLSPKSNTAYSAVDAALNLIKQGKAYEPPNHLKDSHYSGASQLGYGKNYLYPHNYNNSWVQQQYLPDEIKEQTFYFPKNSGHESRLSEIYEGLKKKR